jgi:26S proteasome regulatory subunit N12
MAADLKPAQALLDQLKVGCDHAPHPITAPRSSPLTAAHRRSPPIPAGRLRQGRRRRLQAPPQLAQGPRRAAPRRPPAVPPPPHPAATRSSLARQQPHLHPLPPASHPPQLELTRLPALPPALAPAPDAPAQLQLGREALELGVLAALRAHDGAALERTYAQLRPYYSDARAAAPPSAREPLVVGAALLALLAGGRAAEFHAALELLPAEVAAAPEVAGVLALEAAVAEGAYGAALAALAAPPAPEYAPLLGRLAGAVRAEAAACAAAAHASLAAADAARLLMLGSEAELAAFCAEQGWALEGGRVTFGVKEGGAAAAAGPPAAADLIDRCLTYAKELERIV